MQRLVFKRILINSRVGSFTPRYFSALPSHVVVNMPALSPTMEVGTISKWLVTEGTEVHPGDGIADIATDKASMTFESTDDFFVAKFLVANGSEVKVGDPIMVTVEDADHIGAFADFKPAAAEKAVESPPPPATPKPVEAPKEKAAAPKPTPAPATPKDQAAAPAPVPAPAAPKVASTPSPSAPAAAAPAGTAGGYQWGQAVAKSALAGRLAKEQADYVAKYGRTGHRAVA